MKPGLVFRFTAWLIVVVSAAGCSQAAMERAVSGPAVSAPAVSEAPSDCPAPGQWRHARDGIIPADMALRTMAENRIVLLGELHDRPAHHRWQLHVITGLHALDSEIAIGAEMFPRPAQPVLDDWVAGRLTEAELLERSDWRRIWGIDAELYLPIFHFARMHRIPLIALNAPRAVVRRVAQEGFDSLSAEERDGVGRPAAASQGYRADLLEAYRFHLPEDQRASVGADDTGFVRFVEAQIFRDRAMAETAAEAASRTDRRVIAIMGRGHMAFGFGVPEQLRGLGISEVATALPVSRDEECRGPQGNYAASWLFGQDPN